MMPTDDKDKGKDKKPGDGTKDTPGGEPSPTFTGGHKAALEINVTFRTEADPDSETVKTFLKAVGDIASGRAESGGKTES